MFNIFAYTVLLFAVLFMSPPINTTIAEKQFMCRNGGYIKMEKLCDGQTDCRDGSDETKELCYHVICPANLFRCQYGACIERSFKCNGRKDCADNSDEDQCGKQFDSCEKNEFRCKYGECISMDLVCDGEADCTDESDETNTLCEELTCPIGSHRCRRGGCIHLDARCNGFPDCLDASDEDDNLCQALNCIGKECKELKAIVTCPPITSPRIEATCQTADGIIPCDIPVPINTIAEYSCREYFVPAGPDHAFNTQSLCQMDGTWSRIILECEPECGTRPLVVAPLVVNGWEVDAEIWPWHTTLYAKKKDWIFWCGGSLISEKAIITAAHCTYSVMADMLKIAVGKRKRDFKITEDLVQIRQVKSIIMHPLYQDKSGNYGSDIAILELETAITLTENIKPVCIDWVMKDIMTNLRRKKIGVVVGMGINENDTFSDSLRGTSIPVVSNNLCILNQNSDFKKFVTYTAFCAGWANGTGVCNGDSGGGLVFPISEKNPTWIIQGIVSVSPRRRGTSFCDPYFYTVFTKVGVYVHWIDEVLSSIHPERSLKHKLRLRNIANNF